VYNSTDKRLEILTGDVVYSPADWSIMDIPSCQDEAKMLAKHLYNTPSYKHNVLLLTRQRRKDRIDSISNIQFFKQNWNFLDTVNILYEKSSTCSNSGLLPISETGYLLYKGEETPNIKATSWFQEDKKMNATNFWDISINEIESQYAQIKNIYYHKFSWELIFLMFSLSKPLIYRKFIYGLKISEQEMESLSHLLIDMNLSAQLIVKENKKAEQLIKIYENILKGYKNGTKKQ
jgi:hypothetical protein